jgi:hypothetical protein
MVHGFQSNQALHQTSESLAVPAEAGGGAGELVVIHNKNWKFIQKWEE